MAFPVSPVNGQVAVVNNISYTYNSTKGRWVKNAGTQWFSNSDETLKDIIEPITDATSKISTLRTVIGKFKTDPEGTRRSMLIAQDVQKVLPEAVMLNKDQKLGLSYVETIPLLNSFYKRIK